MCRPSSIWLRTEIPLHAGQEYVRELRVSWGFALQSMGSSSTVWASTNRVARDWIVGASSLTVIGPWMTRQDSRAYRNQT